MINFCPSEKIPGLPCTLEALNKIDFQTDFIKNLRLNYDLEMSLKSFSLGLWFLRQAMLEDNLKFMKIKQI